MQLRTKDTQKDYAMLITEPKENLPPTRVVFIMSDLALISASAKSTLIEITKQAYALGNGLQNAAPGEKSGLPNPSVEYLLSIADALKEIITFFESFSTHHPPTRPE